MIERESGAVKYFQFRSLAAQPGLVHAVASRHGGVSIAPFDTLNLSLTVEDQPEHVRENRRRFAAALDLPVEQMATALQVHGKDVWAVEDDGEAPAAADILITNRPGRFLSQRFADCVPLLLFDPVRRAVATAHAGWRGTVLGVGGVAVAALAQRYGSRPSELIAAIGPSIGPCCYEVGPEVLERLASATDCFWPTDRGTAMLDLWRLNQRALLAAGLRAEQVEVAGLCTRCHNDIFFSHRAAGGGKAGRFGTVIGLRA